MDRQEEIAHCRTWGLRPMAAVKPKVSFHSFRNPESQGSLLVETPLFPSGHDPSTQRCVKAHTDRIVAWDANRLGRAFEAVCPGGRRRFVDIPPGKLPEFAQIALDLPVRPQHVRVVYHYHEATGHDCPLIVAVCDKTASKAQTGEAQ